MKIAIVDDIKWVFEPVEVALTEAGHTVLLLDPSSRDELPETVRQLSNFEPDIIVIDHFLNTNEKFTGREVVEALNWPKAKSVGISSIRQDYVCYELSKTGLPSENAMKLFLEELEGFMSRPSPSK